MVGTVLGIFKSTTILSVFAFLTLTHSSCQLVWGKLTSKELSFACLLLQPHFGTPGKQPKKRSKQLVSKAVRQLSKPKTGPPGPGAGTDEAPAAAVPSPATVAVTAAVAPENGAVEKVSKKRGPYKTAKKRPAEGSPAPKASPKKRAVVVHFESPTRPPVPTSQLPSASDSGSKDMEAAVAAAVAAAEAKAGIPLEPGSGHSTPNSGTPSKMTPAQLDRIDSIIDAVIKPPPMTDLLPTVPESVRATVTRLKEVRKGQGKTRLGLCFCPIPQLAFLTFHN